MFVLHLQDASAYGGVIANGLYSKPSLSLVSTTVSAQYTHSIEGCIDADADMEYVGHIKFWDDGDKDVPGSNKVIRSTVIRHLDVYSDKTPKISLKIKDVGVKS